MSCKNLDERRYDKWRHLVRTVQITQTMADFRPVMIDRPDVGVRFGRSI